MISPIDSVPFDFKNNPKHSTKTYAIIYETFSIALQNKIALLCFRSAADFCSLASWNLLPKILYTLKIRISLAKYIISEKIPI